MRFELDIEYPLEKMELNHQRWQAWKRYAYYDRVRVETGIETRNMLYARGVNWFDYMDNVEDHYYHQLLNQKWRIETVPDDFCIDPEIMVLPDTQNCVAAAFGAEITLLEQDAPHVQGCIRTPEDAARLEVPRPTEGYWGKMLAWHQRMIELVEQTRLTFNGRPGRIRVGFKEISDPFTICRDLIGTDAYLWLYDYPQALAGLLDKIIAGYVGWIQYSRKISGNPGRVMYSGGDGGSMLGEEQYRTFIMPRYLQIWSVHPGERLFHMCGEMEHLLPILRDDYHIDEFYGFGYQVAPEAIARELGGHCRLLGNIDPLLIQRGPADKIWDQARHCLQVFAPYGGYALGDGYNIPPGTDMAHIETLVAAAEAYGLPEISKGPLASGEKQPPYDPPLERAFH